MLLEAGGKEYPTLERFQAKMKPADHFATFNLLFFPALAHQALIVWKCIQC